MLKWASIILLAAIILISVLEFTTSKTPLEQLTAARSGGASGDKTVIRLGIAGWQLEEFPWQQAVEGYQRAHPQVQVQTSLLAGTVNNLLLFWQRGHTEFDVVVSWADFEITPFIEYNQSSPDVGDRSLIVDMTDYLPPEKLREDFMNALFAGSSRTDKATGRWSLYELPWMGEVLALNYNRMFFAQRNVPVPKTWEELEQACQALKGLRYTTGSGNTFEVAPITMNFTTFFAQNCYIPLLASYKQGAGICDEKGRLDVSSPQAAQVLTTLKRWYDAGYLSRNSLDINSCEQDLRVLHSAMYTHWQSRGLWAVKDNGRQVIGIAPTPGFQEPGVGSLVCSYGAIVPKCSPVKKAAVDFAYETFCTDKHGFQRAVAAGFEDPITHTHKGGGKMPALREIYKDGSNLDPEIQALRPAMEQGYTYPDPNNWNQVSIILSAEFQKLLSNKHPSADACLAAVRARLAEEVYPQK